MYKKFLKTHIGLRTVKTAVAVIIAMTIVDSYGASSSKLIFAMLGAMAAVQPTFKGSIISCLTQIVGVLFGALTGILLRLLPLSSLTATGIGIILVITLYNAFHINFSPSLPCLIVVMLCTSPNIQPIIYAFGRIWDTAIGLGVGMLINTLIFPYDNSRQIRSAIESLDLELISFLENMFDGDDILPDINEMVKKIDYIDHQLKIFADQRLVLRLRHQRCELDIFRICEGKARELVAQMEVLCRMGNLGRLNDENRYKLKACGADIRDDRPFDDASEIDIVTNYHVCQILILRKELLDSLSNK